MSRHRLFTKENTFWAFLGQVFDSDGGCKEVVRKLQGYAAVRGLKLIRWYIVQEEQNQDV